MLAVLFAAKHVFRYLQGTFTDGLLIRPITSFTLSIACSDANWDVRKGTCHSTTVYVACSGPNLIAWCSKKEPMVSKSSTEAEHWIIAHIVTETIWNQKLLAGNGPGLSTLANVMCDNINATYLTTNPSHRDRLKHLSMNYHFVDARLPTSDALVCYFPTCSQLANIF